jgi:hypothetical protein
MIYNYVIMCNYYFKIPNQTIGDGKAKAGNCKLTDIK